MAFHNVIAIVMLFMSVPLACIQVIPLPSYSYSGASYPYYAGYYYPYHTTSPHYATSYTPQYYSYGQSSQPYNYGGQYFGPFYGQYPAYSPYYLPYRHYGYRNNLAITHFPYGSSNTHGNGHNPHSGSKVKGRTCSNVEVFKPCGCERKCGGDERECNRYNCYADCFCALGFYRRVDGACVPLKECTRACPLSERYSICGGECERTCDAAAATVGCQCTPGCTCLEGYVRSRRGGECVEKCDNETM